MVCCYQKT